MFDPDVLEFIDKVLAEVTLSMRGDDFEEQAIVAVRAKQQVRAALAEVGPKAPATNGSEPAETEAGL